MAPKTIAVAGSFLQDSRYTVDRQAWSASIAFRQILILAEVILIKEEYQLVGGLKLIELKQQPIYLIHSPLYCNLIH